MKNTSSKKTVKALPWQRRAISTPVALLIILILAVIVAGGVLGYQYGWFGEIEETEESTDEVTDHCADMAAPERRALCYLDLAIETDDASLCDEVELANLKSNCLEHFGRIDKGPEASDETVDWQTYRNTDYYFMLQYPGNWYYTITDYTDYTDQTLICFNPKGVSGDCTILFTVSWNTSLNEEYENVRDNFGEGYDYIVKESTISFGGVAGKLVSVQNPQGFSRLLFFERGSFVYALAAINGQETVFDHMVTTFQFTESGEPIPKIDSINPTSGPKGTIVEIRGKGLSGFEGDLDVYFERADGKKTMLTDTFGSYQKTGGTLLKAVVEEPCQEGETVYGRYSGIASVCDYVELTPGTYNVYAEPWGVKSNVVTFEITATDFPFTLNDNYAHAKEVLADSGWVPVIPEIYETNSGLTKSTDPIDPDFPEISYCGTGIDQICTVDFEKGDMRTHLNIKIGGRPPYGPYSEWTVVGNE